MFGSITPINGNQHLYTFQNIDGHEQTQAVNILPIRSLWELEQECFTMYGCARSPRIAGEIQQALEISDTLIQHKASVAGYVESILLHEMLDQDDHLDSMLDAEKKIVEIIRAAGTMTEDEKSQLIEHHIGFFMWHKIFYEKRLAKYKEYFDNNPEHYEQEYDHYTKIIQVITYLHEQESIGIRL